MAPAAQESVHNTEHKEGFYDYYIDIDGGVFRLTDDFLEYLNNDGSDWTVVGSTILPISVIRANGGKYYLKAEITTKHFETRMVRIPMTVVGGSAARIHSFLVGNGWFPNIDADTKLVKRFLFCSLPK